MEPRISNTSVLTSVQLGLMAALAIVVILGILWGIRQKRARQVAREQEETRLADADSAAPIARVGEVRVAEDVAPVAAPAPSTPAPPAPVQAPPVVQAAPVTVDDSPVADEPLPLADEPIAAAVPAEGSPAAMASDLAAPPAPALADGPVTQLKGLGPKVAALLAERGITTVGQIAALDDAQAQALDAQLGAFTGRLTRDRWVEQARLLSVGDVAGFEAAFGRL